MLFKRRLFPKFFGLLAVCLMAIVMSLTSINTALAQDSSTLHTIDTLPYPIHDYRGDFFSNQQSTFDLGQPSNITDSIAYDPETKRYIVYEKIGKRYYRTPTSYSSEEFMQMEAHKAETEYF